MTKNNLFFLNSFFYISVIALLSIFFFSVSLNATAVHAAIPERISSYVTDNAGVFTPAQKSELEQKLYNLQTITNGVQLVVYTEKTIPIDEYLESRSLQIAEQNGVGKKGADNGVLFYLAAEDRKYRWEVGYGMESTLNTALLGRISRDYVVPYFQKGDFAGGINKGIDLVTGVIMNSTDSDVVAVMTESNTKVDTGKVLLYVFLNFLPWIIFIVIFSSILRAKRKAMGKKGKKDDSHYITAATLLLLGGGRGRGGMGGGGFGGGGFSGGGGGFGGGGFGGGF